MGVYKIYSGYSNAYLTVGTLTEHNYVFVHDNDNVYLSTLTTFPHFQKHRIWDVYNLGD